MVMLERTNAGLAQIRLREPDPTASSESKAAIERRMRTASSSFFWPMRLLPAPRRKAMHALYVFYSDVSSITDSEASRTLKLALLADWHAQIALLHTGRPERPVTRALRGAIGRFDLRSEDFLAIIEGMKTVSSTDLRAPSYEQLDRYCEHSVVAVNRIALRILGAAQPDGERLAAALGRGMQLTVILRDLARDAVRQRLYLPRELLHAQGIYATMPSYVSVQPTLPQVCDALAEQAAAYFADAESATITAQGWSMLATTATLSSYRTLLKALRSRGWTRLDDPVRMPACRQMTLLIGHGLIGR